MNATDRFPVLHRMELTFELPGTIDQVWRAIATENGMNAWMLKTDLDEREGGAVEFHMGEDMSSPGIVTGYDAPHRFAIEETQWAALVGQDPGSVGPLATEFLIDAHSGGTCVLRVVSSAYGTGADWEEEFFDGMKTNWAPQFETLRLYLSHFTDCTVTALELHQSVKTEAASAWTAVRQAVPVQSVGDEINLLGMQCVVERMQNDEVPTELLLRTTTPQPGLIGFASWGWDGASTVIMTARFFDDDAAAYIADHRDEWAKWLAEIAASAERSV